MFTDFDKRQKTRLKYHLTCSGFVMTQDNAALSIAGTRLQGTCRLFHSGEFRQFEIDTGAPFTIISEEFWAQSDGRHSEAPAVQWGDGSSPLFSLRWGGLELGGQFHWADLDLYEFGRHDHGPSMRCRLLAYVLSESSPKNIPPVLLGLGCHGIESGGLCLNLAKRSEPDDAWLIGDPMDAIDVPA